jgi:hypothetical protein
VKIGEKVWMAENLNFDIPEGFRLPTKEVFDELVASAGGQPSAGNTLEWECPFFLRLALFG